MTKAARAIGCGLIALCVTAGCQQDNTGKVSQGQQSQDSPSHADKPTADQRSASERKSERPTETTPRTPPTTQQLRTRAEALWSARKQQDWADVFAFHPPDVRREWKVDDFVAWSSENEPFIVEGFRLQNVASESGIGWVEVDYDARVRPYLELPARSATTIERWRPADGQWFVVVGKDPRYSLSPPWTRDQSEEPYLRARFDECWRYRQEGDWRSLWDMVDVNTRNEDEFDEFVEAQELVRFTKHKFHWVEVAGDRGRICVTYTFRLNDRNLSKLKTEPKTVIENWTKRDDQWYIEKTGN